MAESIPAGKLSRRGDAQRKHQKNQRQFSGRVFGGIDRVRPKLIAIRIPAQQRRRRRAIDEHKEFGEGWVFQGTYGIDSGWLGIAGRADLACIHVGWALPTSF
jgi:hypothetical protein